MWAGQERARRANHRSMTASPRPTALEFFAGGGLARLGLTKTFDVIWANDIDAMKAAAYRANFGDQGFVQGDIGALDPTTIPRADLAWASFPCQDLSLAGERGGLNARRSGSFFAFISIIAALQEQGRAPAIIVIENVSGLLTSHQGRDFAAIFEALSTLGYLAGALEIDARNFVPQSRPRVFIVAVAAGVHVPVDLIAGGSPFYTPATARAANQVSTKVLPWSLGSPPLRQTKITDIIDHSDQTFWSSDRMAALLTSLSPKHIAQLARVQATNQPEIGTIYRRTRVKAGVKASFAEVRFDGVAGCLRTPSGGSSRQFLLFVDGPNLKVRSLNAREAMRLMGVPDSYQLPKSQLAGLKIAGDGVAVPVVDWLREQLLGRLIAS
jgi:DNA (cytosine-5)-methyltransferase 1